MNGKEKASEFRRYVALDIHKEYVMVGAARIECIGEASGASGDCIAGGSREQHKAEVDAELGKGAQW